MSRRSAMCNWHWGKSIVLKNVFWEPFRMGGELLLSSLFARYMVCREPHFSSQVPPVTLTSVAGNHQSALQIYWYIRAVLNCWLAPHSHRHNSWFRYRLYLFLYWFTRYSIYFTLGWWTQILKDNYTSFANAIPDQRQLKYSPHRVTDNIYLSGRIQLLCTISLSRDVTIQKYMFTSPQIYMGICSFKTNGVVIM